MRGEPVLFQAESCVTVALVRQCRRGRIGLLARMSRFALPRTLRDCLDQVGARAVHHGEGDMTLGQCFEAEER